MKIDDRYYIWPHDCTCGETIKKEDCEHIGDTDHPIKLDWYKCPHEDCGTAFVKVKGT